MKKIILFFSICLTVGLTSCFEEVEVFDTETLDYSGRWYFQVKAEDGAPLHNYGSHMLNVYNTSENVSDKIWIDDIKNIFGTRIKYDLNGGIEAFSSVDQTEGGAGLNARDYPRVKNDPAGPDETAMVSNFFNKGVVVEGKILKLGGSSKTGTPVDSIYMKLKFFAGEIEYKSIYDDATKKYKWDDGTFTYYAEPDTTVMVGGTMHTGFPEDDY